MKNSNKHTISRYDLLAPFYNLMEWPAEQLLFSRWKKRLWENIKGPEVLEIGIGTGKNIPFHPSRVRITGMDISTGMLSRANRYIQKHHIKNVALEEADVQKLPYPDNSFDTVAGTFVFCSVPDPVLGLQEALRVTKPGGHLYLLEHILANNKWLAAIMRKMDSTFHFVTGVHIARETISNIEKAGWKIQRAGKLTSNGIFRMIEARKSEL